MSLQECENHHAAHPAPMTAAERVRASMQLEFWIAGKRRGSGSWVPQHLTFGIQTTGRVPWRRVKPGHTHKDKLPHSLALRAGYARTREDQCNQYCQWARLAGIQSVAVFANDWRGINAAHKFGFEYREVDPAEFIGPTIADEVYL